MFRQVVCGAPRGVERVLRAVDLDHAPGGAIVGDAGLGADLLQRLQRMERQDQVGAGIGAELLGRAIAGEFEAPAPHLRDRAVAQQQRRILAAEPLDDLHRHAGLRPRLDLAGMDDAAIAPAGLHAGRRLALDHHDVVAGLGEVPGGGGADGAGAQDDRGHAGVPRLRPFLPARWAGLAGARRPAHIASFSRSIRAATSRATLRMISSCSRLDSV